MLAATMARLGEGQDCVQAWILFYFRWLFARFTKATARKLYRVSQAGIHCRLATAGIRVYCIP